MQITQIKETCLYSSRLEETKEFYTRLLGLQPVNYIPGKHLFLKAGSSMLLFFNPDDSKTKLAPPGHYGSGKIHVAFEVPSGEYHKAKEKLKNSGVPIIHEENWDNNLQSFYFNDPNGNVLEIVTPGLWD